MLDPSGDSPYGVAVAQRGSDHCFFPQVDEGHPFLLLARKKELVKEKAACACACRLYLRRPAVNEKINPQHVTPMKIISFLWLISAHVFGVWVLVWMAANFQG